MYCYHCGKEIAEEALMCPNCGAPTKNTNVVKQEEIAPVASNGVNINALSVVGLVLSLIGFVTGIIFGSFFLCYSYSIVLLYILSGSTILPALAGLSIGIYTLVSKNGNNHTAKACAICSIVFASVVILFLFIGGCVIASGTLGRPYIY